MMSHYLFSWLDQTSPSGNDMAVISVLFQNVPYQTELNHMAWWKCGQRNTKQLQRQTHIKESVILCLFDTECLVLYVRWVRAFQMIS